MELWRRHSLSSFLSKENWALCTVALFSNPLEYCRQREMSFKLGTYMELTFPVRAQFFGSKIGYKSPSYSTSVKFYQKVSRPQFSAHGIRVRSEFDHKVNGAFSPDSDARFLDRVSPSLSTFVFMWLAFWVLSCILCIFHSAYPYFDNILKHCKSIWREDADFTKEWAQRTKVSHTN